MLLWFVRVELELPGSDSRALDDQDWVSRSGSELEYLALYWEFGLLKNWQV